MLREFAALTRRELLRIGRNPQAIFMSLLVPILYLLLFGQAFNLGSLSGGSGSSGVLRPGVLGAPGYFLHFSLCLSPFRASSVSFFPGARAFFDVVFSVYT